MSGVDIWQATPVLASPCLSLLSWPGTLYALLTFALELYQAVGALVGLLPLGDPLQRHIAAASIALVINSLTQQPLRQWIERG